MHLNYNRTLLSFHVQGDKTIVYKDRKNYSLNERNLQKTPKKCL